jgi:O-antigen ligase
MRYGLNVALFLIVFTAVRERRHVTLVVAVFVLGTIFSAAYGIAFPPENADSISRAAGAAGKPHEFATTLLVGMLMATGLVGLRQQRPFLRVLGAIAIPLAVAGIALALSRAGLLALAAALAAAVVFGGRYRRKALALAVALGIGLATYFVAFASTDALARVSSAGDGSGRTTLWTVALRMVEDRPLHGVGVGQYEINAVHYAILPGVLRRTDLVIDNALVPHSVYLHIWAELGVIGLVLWLALVLFCIRCAVRAAQAFARDDDGPMEVAARACAVALIALSMANLFSSQQFNKHFWFLLALGPALLSLAEREHATSAGAHGRRRRGRGAVARPTVLRPG